MPLTSDLKIGAAETGQRVHGALSVISATLIIAVVACSSDSATRPLVVLDLAPCDSSGRGDRFSADHGPEATLPDASVVDSARTPDGSPLDLRPWDTVPPPDSNMLPELQVFILAGQSNMVGLGYNDQLSGDEAGDVSDATIYYNDGLHPNTNTKIWLPLGPGFGITAARYGPELGFGHCLRQLWPGRPFAIIKVAQGGTALHGAWKAQSGSFYQLLVAEVQGQLAVLSSSWQPKLAGLVWMQGESDGVTLWDASAYQGRLADLINTLRQDLGVPRLPVVAGLVSPHPNWPYGDLVRAGTAALTAVLPPMEVVETADLTRDPADDIHYDSAGSLILGRRFAEAMAALLSSI